MPFGEEDIAVNRSQFTDFAVIQSPFHTSCPSAVDVAEHLRSDTAALHGGDNQVCIVGIQCHRLVEVDMFPCRSALRADAPAPFHFRAETDDMHILACECRV